jgi:protein involved in polysaccharide export with SLBB domain
MHRPAARWRSGWGGALALILATGCAPVTGNRFTLFPEGHRLTDAARDMRAAAPHPLPLPRELDKKVAEPYVVEPGDVLLVAPANLESPVRLPGDQPVLPDGTIQLGRYGRPVVAGRTVEEIEALVKPLIEAQTKDAGPVTVRLVTRQSKVYYVLGEVNAPGAFPLQGRETALDAIVAAGGLNNQASRRNIILSRPTAPGHCRVVLPVCYNEIVQLGDTSTNYQVAAGDRIYVPTRTLCEDLLHRKKECPPCGGPQVPCTALGWPGGGHGPGPGAPPPPPAPLDMPRPLPPPALLDTPRRP